MDAGARWLTPEITPSWAVAAGTMALSSQLLAWKLQAMQMVSSAQRRSQAAALEASTVANVAPGRAVFSSPSAQAAPA
jgi:hypothetical protein